MKINKTFNENKKISIVVEDVVVFSNSVATNIVKANNNSNKEANNSIKANNNATKEAIIDEYYSN